MEILNGAAPNANKLDELRGYCEQNWRLLPLWEKDENGICVCRNRNRCDEKHARIKWQKPEPGQSGATSDWAIVQEWHRRWPNADWAVALDDVFVVDVDVKYGGMETLAELDDDPAMLGITLVQQTPSGGRQFFYRQPAERDITTLKQGKLHNLPGFEVKAAGGYVGIPPSRGRKWLSHQTVSEASPYLLQAIRKAATVRTTSGSEGGSGEVFDWTRAMIPAEVPPGEQQDWLYRGACSLRAQGVNDSLAKANLRQMISAFVIGDPHNPWQLDDADAMWERVKKELPDGRTQVAVPQKLHDWAQAQRSEGEEAEEQPFMLTAAQVRDRPPLQWQVEDVLPERALVQIFGQTGQYKTFVVIDLLGQLSNGEAGNFLGKEIITDGPGLCCMVLGEGGGDIGERISAWAEANPDLTDENLYFVVDQALNLLNADDVNRLGENLVKVSVERGLPWRLIVFDTQADHLPSNDERDEATFSALKPVLLHLSKQTGASIGLVHHTGWNDERERGSSRQRQMLDIVMEIKDSSVRAVKVKAGPLFEAIPFAVRPVGESLAVFTPSDMERANATRDKYTRDGEEMYRKLAELEATAADPATQTLVMEALGWGKSRVRLAGKADERIQVQAGGGRGRSTYYWLTGESPD